MNNTALPPDAIFGLAVALGVGLLVGVERERRKGAGDQRAAAGLRTFAITAMAGALAQLVHAPSLVPIGAVLVALLAAVSHWKSRSNDPGITTEIALFAIYLTGVLSIASPSLAAGCGTGLALLLASRSRLHHFATQLLTEQELHDAVLLAALALIVLPLIPSAPIEILGGITPRPLAALVLLIMAIQAAGQTAMRWFGVRAGILGSGLLSGFVSSTATVASFGSRARRQPSQTRLLASGASLSAVATWLQALMISAALSPRAAFALLPTAAAGAAAAAILGLLPVLFRGTAIPPESPIAARSALRPHVALAIALALALAALLVGTAQQHFGDSGLRVGVALAALLDAHAPVATLASLHASGALTPEHFVQGVLIAIAANTVTRCTVAVVARGVTYGLRLALSLLAGFAIAAGIGYWRQAYLAG
jgi:uncharacterized membrane protein (DUF4010 family)